MNSNFWREIVTNRSAICKRRINFGIKLRAFSHRFFKRCNTNKTRDSSSWLPLSRSTKFKSEPSNFWHNSKALWRRKIWFEEQFYAFTNRKCFSNKNSECVCSKSCWRAFKIWARFVTYERRILKTCHSKSRVIRT